ncbi:MAG: hypothetical protein GYB68_04140 [Chloroflexi bacterium]|nr:hypothetical protein [Chloroflexota bacterium]
MPYTLDRHPQEQRLVQIHFSGGLTAEDLMRLRSELTALTGTGETLGLLFNLAQSNAMQVLNSILTGLDGVPLPGLSTKAGESRLAIAEGGSVVEMILGLVGGTPSGLDNLRFFDSADEATDWLLTALRD